jgi:hypothetical protein
MRELVSVSDERKSRSPDDQARQFVIDALSSHDVRPELEALREEVIVLREDLVTALAYVIQLTAKIDGKSARRTAEQVFRKERNEE